MTSWISHLVSGIRLKVSYEQLDDEEVVKTVLAHDKNNDKYYNVVGDLESDDDVEECLFEEQIEDEIEVTSNTELNQKSCEGDEKFASFR